MEAGRLRLRGRVNAPAARTAPRRCAQALPESINKQRRAEPLPRQARRERLPGSRLDPRLLLGRFPCLPVQLQARHGRSRTSECPRRRVLRTCLVEDRRPPRLGGKAAAALRARAQESTGWPRNSMADDQGTGGQGDLASGATTRGAGSKALKRRNRSLQTGLAPGQGPPGMRARPRALALPQARLANCWAGVSAASASCLSVSTSTCRLVARRWRTRPATPGQSSARPATRPPRGLGTPLRKSMARASCLVVSLAALMPRNACLVHGMGWRVPAAFRYCRCPASAAPVAHPFQTMPRSSPSLADRVVSSSRRGEQAIGTRLEGARNQWPLSTLPPRPHWHSPRPAPHSPARSRLPLRRHRLVKAARPQQRPVHRGHR